jgi:hypothetical protein
MGREGEEIHMDIHLDMKRIGVGVIIAIFGVIPTIYLLHGRIPHVQVSMQQPVSPVKASAPAAAPIPAPAPAPAPTKPKQVPSLPGVVQPEDPEDVVSPDLAAMRAAVSLTVTGKHFTPEQSDPYASAWLGLNIVVKNTGTKAVHAFQGVIIIKDVLGNTIDKWAFKFDDGLQPGHSKSVAWGANYNEYMHSDRLIYSTAFSNLKFEWNPKTVLFTDGTKLGKLSDEQ